MYTDTFSAFAFKVLAAVKGMPDSNRTKYLQGKEVRFNGSPVNKTMMTAILLFDGKIDAHGLKILHPIERNHGREMLSTRNVVHKICKLAAEVKAHVQDLVTYYLAHLDSALRAEMMTAKDVTGEFLDNNGKDGTPGHVQMTIYKKELIGYIVSMTDDLRNMPSAAQDVKDLDKVLPHFQDYDAFEKAFPILRDDTVELCIVEDAVAASHGHANALVDVAETEMDGPERMKKGLCKAACQTVDFLYDLMGGNYDDVFKQIGHKAGAVQ